MRKKIWLKSTEKTLDTLNSMVIMLALYILDFAKKKPSKGA